MMFLPKIVNFARLSQVKTTESSSNAKDKKKTDGGHNELSFKSEGATVMSLEQTIRILKQ